MASDVKCTECGRPRAGRDTELEDVRRCDVCWKTGGVGCVNYRAGQDAMVEEAQKRADGKLGDAALAVTKASTQTTEHIAVARWECHHEEAAHWRKRADEFGR